MIPSKSPRIDELVAKGEWTKPEEKKVDTGAKLVATYVADNHTMGQKRVWVDHVEFEAENKGDGTTAQPGESEQTKPE